MGGLENLFKKLTPFIMLICFICFGITYAFNPKTDKNLTYLQTQYYDINTGEIIENPTKAEKEQAEKYYTFDMVSYTKNIDINIITRATTDVFNIEAYTETAEKFNNIWNDGYQFGDVTKTILNAIIMVINTLILIINIFLFPLRVLSGILLTGLSIIGININNGIIIIPFLKIVLDSFKIPFIQPTNEKAAYDNELTYTTWIWNQTKLNNKLNSMKDNEYFYIRVNFGSLEKNGSLTKFDSLWIHKNSSTSAVINYSINGKPTVVYQNGWKINTAKTIEIQRTNLTGTEVTQITQQLNSVMTKQNRSIEIANRTIFSNKADNKKYYLQYC